jgi:hypothetical protein
MKGDERILGQGDFVETVLKAAQENLDRKSMIRALGYDFEWLVDRVTGLFGLAADPQRLGVPIKEAGAEWHH